MAKIKYIERTFQPASRATIEQANAIIAQYTAQGYKLSLRQLYYRFVATGLRPNTERSYKNLGNLMNDARMAGLVDWDAIEDRTRNLEQNSHWADSQDMMESAAEWFAIDKWHNQPYRPEVWIEKDALVGVIAGMCEKLDVPYLSCRGYASVSEMWAGAMRMRFWAKSREQIPIIFDLRDHDPSGIDMTGDVRRRMKVFTGGLKVERLALNWDQVEQYNPPPNPAKVTDSRADAYIAEFGESSWELDALEPDVLHGLIEDAVLGVRDEEKWEEAVEEQEDMRKQLSAVEERWPDVLGFLEEQEDD